MRNKIIRNICIISLCIVLFIYVSIWTSSTMYENKMSFFSYRFYVMSYDIVEYDMHSGDMIIVKNIKNEEIKKNDKIVYEVDGNMGVEEVKGVENEGGKIDFIIENDHLLSDDKQEEVRIIGKVVNSISGLGNIALFLQSPIGILDVLIIILCMFVLIKKISRNMNEDNRYEYEKVNSTKE